MSKGLKQSVEEAMQPEAKPPVEVSGEALYAIASKVREWSGWADAKMVLADPRSRGMGSPFAACLPSERTFIANPDTLVLNPHRVLLTITPFRLRQEAVLTGALLHEAGHARHSHWRSPGKPVLHNDGAEATKQAVALATLLEEPRVERLIAAQSESIGALGLDWTMRASAAHLVPTTEVSMDPKRAVMDFITSWVLRAGRQIGIKSVTPGHRLPSWVGDFTKLLHTVLVQHIASLDTSEDDLDLDSDPMGEATSKSQQVIGTLIEMIECDDDRGTTMVDKARDILDLLFPETDGDDEGAPMPPEMHAQPGESEEGEGEGKPEKGEPEDGEGGGAGSEPEKDKPEDKPEDESGEQESGEGEGQDESEEPGDGPGEGESEPEDDAREGESEDGQAADADDDTDPEREDGASPGTTDSPLQQALAEMEAQAQAAQDGESEVESQAQPPLEQGPSGGAGSGGNGGGHGGWRQPTKAEFEVQKGAERFLRNMIEPSEKAKITLTESPSATVDGAALSAWKAGGQIREPHFFRRTRREVEPSPPIRIGVLVDVSSSMDEMQKPSALLSWALASAAMDLRNFAGRGTQVESCLIHWGSSARVIQRNGEVMPGIREFPCIEGTSAMVSAMDLLGQELPGFFDQTEKPVNRLLVQFTDWQLFGSKILTTDRVSKALAAGVNMVSVVPDDYSPRRADLDLILKGCKVQRGRSSVMKYNPMFPERVWDVAAEVLDGRTPAPFAGF